MRLLQRLPLGSQNKWVRTWRKGAEKPAHDYPRDNPGRPRSRLRIVSRHTAAAWCSVLVPGLLIAMAGGELSVSAQAAFGQSDDPLELSHWAQEVGPQRVLGLLDPDQAPLLQLRAIRAAHALSRPEHCLRALLPLMCGDDPDLAPAAARAALQIAHAVTDNGGLREELDREALAALARDYEAAAETQGMRADLVLISVQVATQLAEVASTGAQSGEETPPAL